MCTDDLVKVEQGLRNAHQHEVEVLVTQGMLGPGEVLTKVQALTADAYLKEASKLDAELLVNRVAKYVQEKYQIPLPRPLLTKLVEEVFAVIRQMAIESEVKDRKILKRAQLQKQVAEKLKKAKKAKEPEEEEPLT